jgi:hypothetical protein
MPPVTTPSSTMPPLVSVLLTTSMPPAPTVPVLVTPPPKLVLPHQDLAGRAGERDRKRPRVSYGDTSSIFKKGSPAGATDPHPACI